MTVHLPVVYTIIHKAVTEWAEETKREKCEGTGPWPVWQNVGPQWVLYNLAGLYWRIIGNNYHGVECLRRSLHLSPPEYRDVPLNNLANILYRWGRIDDALIVMKDALNISDFEVRHWVVDHPDIKICNGWMGIKHQVTYCCVVVVLVGWWETDCKWQRIEPVEKSLKKYCHRYGCCGWGLLLMEWSDKGVDKVELSAKKYA